MGRAMVAGGGGLVLDFLGFVNISYFVCWIPSGRRRIKRVMECKRSQKAEAFSNDFFRRWCFSTRPCMVLGAMPLVLCRPYPGSNDG